MHTEERRRQQAELRARETEWALEKAEQLLRAHEETSGFYIQKAKQASEEAGRQQQQAARAAADLQAQRGQGGGSGSGGAEFSLGQTPANVGASAGHGMPGYKRPDLQSVGQLGNVLSEVERANAELAARIEGEKSVRQETEAAMLKVGFLSPHVS